MPKISDSFVLREKPGFQQLLSQRRNILRLTETLEFLLIIRGGTARRDIFQQVTKIWLNHLLTALSLG